MLCGAVERPKVVRVWFFKRFDFDMCFAPQLRVLFEHLNFQKRSDSEFFVFFNILTFEFEMCFAPQRRAIFEQLNFQKFSKREPNVVCFADFDFEGSRVHFSTS